MSNKLEIEPKKFAPEPKRRILGTADYMAPEVIKGEEHTFSLDFWSLGVIAFQFLVGRKPFSDENNVAEKVFKKILNKELTYPEIGTEEGQLSAEAIDFIDKLLTIDPKKRLGSHGIDEVKGHPFFKDI